MSTGKKALEIACFSYESAIIAQNAGADRIELCENYTLGGITPSHESIQQVRQKIHLPLHVIIRPRGGDFIYSADELERMKKDILFCKYNGVNGIVFGCLNTNAGPEIKVCEELKTLAGTMSVTFHRAIDECSDINDAIKSLVKIGISRVLSSGGKKNATEGIAVLQDLQKKFGDQIIIMPGGGIRSSNIQKITGTGCNEFHSAAITGNQELADADEIKKLKLFL